MRPRAEQNRLKSEHSIIDGLRPLLNRLLANTPTLRSIILGAIKPAPAAAGWSAIALSAGARQELFVSTALTKIEVEVAFDRALEGC